MGQPNRYRSAALRTRAGDAKRTGAALKYSASLAALRKGKSPAGQGEALKRTDDKPHNEDSTREALYHPLTWRTTR